MNEQLKDFLNVYEEILKFEQDSLPLCAAENVSSFFSKLPHISILQEKYILGGIIKYQDKFNFCGSDILFNIYNLVQKQCNKMFASHYCDARTLSGLNCITTILMSLFNIGDKIMITSSDYGGHSSMKLIAERLGMKVIDLPFNYDNNDFDYSEINKILKCEKINGILIALSDTIEHPNLKKIDLKDEILIYDATQLLGLIATGYIDNPMEWFPHTKKMIMLGATHKTIPGPTCGLILTNNNEIANQIDLKINPDYLRNIQMNSVVSLLFSLYELDVYGKEYFNKMNRIINILATELEKKKMKVIKTRDNTFSNTHQLWISLDDVNLEEIESRAYSLGISLNIRNRRIYKNKGIRLGLQQIARYNWDDLSIIKIAEILYQLTKKNFNYNKIKKLISALPTKKIYFTFSKEEIEVIFDKLHNGNM